LSVALLALPIPPTVAVVFLEPVVLDDNDTDLFILSTPPNV
jgi:hypothetical protein